MHYLIVYFPKAVAGDLDMVIGCSINSQMFLAVLNMAGQSEAER